MSDMIKGTMISYRPDIKVLDATIRDGGLVNNFEFTDDFVRKLYLTNLRAGVDIMEIGYLADPELFEESKFGKWKFCHEDAIRKVLGDILDPKMQLAVMADVGRANVARDLPDKKDSILDVVRIATYINTIPAAIEMIETCAKKGYHTTVNIMAVSKAQESELEEALEMLGKSSVEVIYLVDSYGSLSAADASAGTAVSGGRREVRQEDRYSRPQQPAAGIRQHHRVCDDGRQLSGCHNGGNGTWRR